MAERANETGSAARSRTYTWDDPMPSVEARRRLSGIEYLRGFLDETFPPAPIAQTVGMRFVEVEEGRAVFEGGPGEYHYNRCKKLLLSYTLSRTTAGRWAAAETIASRRS